jgi:hypothetical protein
MNVQFRFLATCLLLGHLPSLFSQTSPIPDPLPGPAAIVYDTSRHAYIFHAVGVDYAYSLDRGGSLVGLTARLPGSGEEFTPSYYGGVTAELEGKIREPWSEDGQRNLAYTLVKASQIKDTVVAIWAMRYGRDAATFTLRIRVVNQTLIIDIEGDSSGLLSGIGFNHAYPSVGTKVIRIPALTLLSVLYCSSSRTFVSLFTDWERTEASSITPWVDRGSTGTGYYSQHIGYSKLSNGRRNLLRERVYLSVARELPGVLPNVVGSPAPRRKELWNRIVLSYSRFFPWILHAPANEDPMPDYLDMLYNAGVRHLALIVKDWSRGQFDHAFPCTWPPDEYRTSACWSAPVSGPGEGGAEGLRKLRDSVRSKGYYFGLHENYTNFHSEECDLAARIGPGEYSGLLPDGTSAKTFFNDCRDHPSQAELLKPSLVKQVARWSMGEVIRGLGGTKAVDWSYIDVATAINPSGPVAWDARSSYVDFDSRVVGAGKFAGTLNAYRNLASVVREMYAGPVQGEGTNHFLYAGYFDGFEARLTTADDRFSGEAVPLLLEFDLLKLHTRSAYSGAGHIQYFFGTEKEPHQRLTKDETLEYMATELAFGHAGLVTKAVLPDYDHSLSHAVMEERYGLPIQKLYGNARAVAIAYFDAQGSKSASQFITDHMERFDDRNSTEFMGKVRVAYDNGVVIYVNRSLEPWAVSPTMPAGGWCSYHVMIGGKATLGTGLLPSTTVILPGENGWVAYSPLQPDPGSN